MRIGVFGGSFDPPHSAHAQVVEAAIKAAHLDRVLWVPTFLPPHKDLPAAPFSDRVQMVKTLIGSHGISEVSEIEASLPQPSYTLTTLVALKRLHGAEHDWFLILGADNWAIFPTWHQSEVVLAQARLLVYPRQGFTLDGLPKTAIALNHPLTPWQSRTIRKQLQFEPEQALANLPVPVANYIRQHRLYGLGSGRLG